ncbi:MAG: hypothetical protein FWF59_01730, partial [Turicibacter sp.]|nr:hypothetical protein [Turicibacter sp.]
FKKQIGNDCALVRRTKSRGISPKTGKFTPQNCKTPNQKTFATFKSGVPTVFPKISVLLVANKVYPVRWSSGGII